MEARMPQPTYRQLAKEHAAEAEFLRDIAAQLDGISGRIRFRLIRRADRLAHLAEQALGEDKEPK